MSRSTGNSTRPFRREFHFVDPANSNHRRNARSHMVTERSRKLRWCGSVTQKDSDQELRAFSKPVEFVRDPTAKHRKGHRYGQRIKLSGFEHPRQVTCESHVVCIPRCVGRGGIDPFQTLPVESSPEILQLVDHYTRVIPTLLPISAHSGIREHEVAVDLFHLYRLHPASFLGMLYHAARHKESLYKAHREKSLSLTFKIKALREVNRQLEKARTRGMHADDGTILAIYQLSIAERMWGDLNTFRLHWRAMYDIIDARGGAKAFATDDLMYKKILWNCFALLNARDGYFNCPRDTPVLGANYDFQIPTEIMISNCHCFVQSYNERRASVLRLLPISEAESLLQGEAYPRRLKSFQPGTVLHQVLLASSQRSVKGCSLVLEAKYTPPNRFIQIPGDRLRTDNCRLSCIIYINLLLLKLGDFSDSTELFLCFLEETLSKNTHIRSPEYLLWTLLRTPYQVASETSRELWSRAIQIIAVVKRAVYQNIICYQEAMSLFLQLPANPLELAPTFEVNLKAIQDEALRYGPSTPFEETLLSDSVTHINYARVESRIYCELIWFAGRL